MTTEKWSYVAIDINGAILAGADSYEELETKIAHSSYACIYHREDKESSCNISTIISIDESKINKNEMLGAIAKSMNKTLDEVQKML